MKKKHLENNAKRLQWILHLILKITDKICFSFFLDTLLNLSGGTFFNTIGSIVWTLANHASGINSAHTTWHQATKTRQHQKL